MNVSRVYWSNFFSVTLIVALLYVSCAQPSTTSEEVPSTIPATTPMPGSATLELTAKHYFEQGIALSMSGQYGPAIQDLTRAIEIDPIYAEAYYLRGSAYMGNKEYDKALIDLDRAVALGVAGQDVPGLKQVVDSIVAPGELILLGLRCTSEGGIDCQGNPKPYTNTLHIQLFVNPGEHGIEIDKIYISPPISARSQVNSPIRFFHNMGIEHLVICISSAEPPTTPPTCSVDYKLRDTLSFKRSNKVSCAEIEIERLICPR